MYKVEDNSNKQTGFFKSIKNIPQNFKLLDSKTKKLLGVGMAVILVVALPLFVWAIVNMSFNVNKRASSGEPVPTSAPSFGQALVFNGSSYVSINNSQGIHPQKSFTVEGWVKPSQPTFNYSIVDKTTGSQNSFHLTAKSEVNPASPTYTVTYTFGVADSSLSCAMRSVTFQESISASQITKWTHIAAVIQPQGAMDIFVDGRKSFSSSNSISTICQNALPIQIGARNQGNGFVDGYFTGMMDEVRISNTAIYNGNFIPPSNPFSYNSSTVVLYDLDGNLANKNSDSYYGIHNGNTLQFVQSDIRDIVGPSPSNQPTPTGNLQCPAAQICLDGAPFLKNCTPPEADNTPQESICNFKGRVEMCGGKQFCCPSNGGKWTTNLTACEPTGTPKATPSSTPTPFPTSTGGDVSCVNQCGDRVCNQLTCQGTGCACAESVANCPIDCAGTPSPVSSPVANSVPTIENNNYVPHVGFVGTTYKTVLSARDINLSDNLSAGITGLPAGLSYNCTTTRPASQLTKLRQQTPHQSVNCTIIGTLRTAGRYTFTFTVSDQKPGGKVSKSFNLWVLRLPWRR